MGVGTGSPDLEENCKPCKVGRGVNCGKKNITNIHHLSHFLSIQFGSGKSIHNVVEICPKLFIF